MEYLYAMATADVALIGVVIGGLRWALATSFEDRP